MYLTISKSKPNSKEPDGGVVIEVKVSLAEAKAHAHRSPLLESAIDDALAEHMRMRTTVNRRVNSGDHA